MFYFNGGGGGGGNICFIENEQKLPRIINKKQKPLIGGFFEWQKYTYWLCFLLVVHVESWETVSYDIC